MAGGELWGRQGELDAVRRFLEARTSSSGALLIEGGMGIGKSALLGAAMAMATAAGFLVLAAGPDALETALPYAALFDLLDGVLDGLAGALPEAQLGALRAAILPTPAETGAATPLGPTVQPLTVAAAFLGLVRSLSRRSPVLIAVDDGQWLDPSSAAAIHFVARRLGDEPVGLVVARRAEPEDPGDPRELSVLAGLAHRQLETVRLSPLTEGDLVGLLRARPGPGLSARQMRQVVEAAAGNPFFALELRAAVARTRGPSGQPLLEVPGSLAATIDRRLDTLPREVQRALLVVASLAQPTVGLVRRALAIPTPGAGPPPSGGDVAGPGRGGDVVGPAGGGDPPRPVDRAPAAPSRVPDHTWLGPALADRILVRDGQRLRFSHPLLRSAAARRASAHEAAALHRRLADLVSEPIERAWHLVAATAEPDARLAGRIATGAAEARRRGGPDEAAELYLAAADGLPERNVARRQAWRRAAAECLVAAGASGRAQRLLEDLVATTPPGPERADEMLRLATMRYRRDEPGEAIALLEEALPQAAGAPRTAAAIEQQLALTRTMLGDLAAAAEHAARASGLARASGDEAARSGALAFGVMIDFLRGRGIDGRRLALALALEPEVGDRPVEWRPSTIKALILWWSGKAADAAPRFEALHAEAQERGDDDAIPYLLYARCQVELACGATELAEALAEAARARLEETTGAGSVDSGGLVQALLGASVARVDALAGRAASARRLAEAGLATSQRRGYGPGIQENAEVLGLLALAEGDPERCAALLRPLAGFLAGAGIGEPGVLRFVPDLAEALVEIGRLDEAEQVLAPQGAAARQLHRRPALAGVLRGRALVALARSDADTALTVATEAVRLHARAGLPFELARSRLVLGQVHRRRLEKRAAEAELSEAEAAFEDLAAPLWVARAAAARRRVGLRPRASAELSATERQVAELAAVGLTGRQIAAQAFLSPKGVEKALARVYRKLGITSRAELGRRMGPQPGDSDGGGPPLHRGPAPS